MLKKRMAYHGQAMISSMRFFFEQPWAAAITVLVIGITLALPAFFWVVSDNLVQVTRHWQEEGRISLYLTSSLSPEKSNVVLLRVRATPGVGTAVLITPAEGLALLQTQEGMHDILRHLPENPLPAVIEVTPDAGVATPGKIEELSARLKSYTDIEQVKLDRQWIHRLQVVFSCVAKVAHGLMWMLALAVVVIIGNTLRLTIQHHQEEVQVLKLIGATDAFIMRPFLYGGLWYALAGTLVAVLFVNLLLFSLSSVVNQLAAAYDMQYPISVLSVRQVTGMLISALILGWAGAWMSIKRQIAFIEPYSSL